MAKLPTKSAKATPKAATKATAAPPPKATGAKSPKAAPIKKPVEKSAVSAAPKGDTTKPKVAKSKATKTKDRSPTILQLAADIIADRIVPTVEQIKSIAISITHDGGKGQSAKAKKKKKK